MQYKVPPQGLYAAVRDYLLDSSGEKYYPLTYLNQMDDIKPGQLSPTAELSRKTSQLLVIYEAFRKKLVFCMQRFFEVRVTYAAWLYYKRLSVPINRMIL